MAWSFGKDGGSPTTEEDFVWLVASALPCTRDKDEMARPTEEGFKEVWY